MMSAALALALACTLQSEETFIELLRNEDPEVRAFAARMLAGSMSYRAAPHLIERLRDGDENVRLRAHEALCRITTKEFPITDEAAWRTWWREEGMRLVGTEAPTAGIAHELERMEKQIERVERQVNLPIYISLGLWGIFMILVVYFSAHLASKLKEWKEVMKQAELFLKESEEVTKRTDKVLDELDAKKTEVVEFFGKTREENQAEMERFTDLLEQNTEHRIRLEMMELRQKAEKELEQSLENLRASVDHEFRRLAAEHKSRVEKELAGAYEKFRGEAEVYTLFLQAGFLAANGRREEALRVCKRLTGQRAEFAPGWTQMGTVLRDLGRHDEALEAYTQALSRAPDDPTVHYQMAATYALMKKRENMIASLKRALGNNGEFKDEALNDAAFKTYWNDPEFRDLAEG